MPINAVVSVAALPKKAVQVVKMEILFICHDNQPTGGNPVLVLDWLIDRRLGRHNTPVFVWPIGW